MKNLLTKLFGTKSDRDLKRFSPMVDRINSFEKQIKILSDSQLQGKTAEFRESLDRGEKLDNILFEAFAVCREAAFRRVKMRHYDVQLIGGLVLHEGSIAEMRTGEGKTLVATLPTYLNSLSGKGVHVVTVNDYLATRDCEWMGDVYRWLGLTTGTITNDLDDTERKEAYGADITYGTNNEFGFDYLRDNMKFELKGYVQRPHHYAIVDECDSILIDEARTPLIISGPSGESTEKYYEINKVIPSLEKEKHFTMEEKTKTVSLTEEGNAQVEKLLKIDNIFEPHNIQFLHHIYQGLKAHHLFSKDVDYMVKDDEVVIVDEFTGRLMPGRRWSDGLHQAIDAKEGVEIKGENQTLATITFQNYFRMYEKLSGMTGTAATEAVEFKKIYNLDVHVIPTNRPIVRLDVEDVIYKTEEAKFKAIANDVGERSVKGQPVLVGTVSIERSERLSNLLKREKVPHNVLNAKNHQKEAEFVAQAGRKGFVTIATNMAGRGTDIVLGGNPEKMLEVMGSDSWDEERTQKELEKFQIQCESEKKDVIASGGLCIVGTERHESRRIDNQLRGRSGRQGDPGESCFYLSLEDDLMRIFNGERLQKIMNTLKVPDDEPITARMVSRSIEGAQRKVEGHNFDIRKHLLEYDDVMNQQRTAIYDLRKRVLESDSLDEVVRDMMGSVASNILDRFVGNQEKSESWDIDGLNTALAQQFGVTISFADDAFGGGTNGALNSGADGAFGGGADGAFGGGGNSKKVNLSLNQLNELVKNAIKAQFESQKKSIGEFFHEVEKVLTLETIDRKWKEHLAQIDQLKESVNLRAYAQKDPLIEYKKEGFRLFEKMNFSIQCEILEKLFKIQIASEEETQMKMRREQNLDALDYEGSDGAELGLADELVAMAREKQQFQMNQARRSVTGGGDEENLNRAERRRRKKMSRNKKR